MFIRRADRCLTLIFVKSRLNDIIDTLARIFFVFYRDVCSNITLENQKNIFFIKSKSRQARHKLDTQMTFSIGKRSLSKQERKSRGWRARASLESPLIECYGHPRRRTERIRQIALANSRFQVRCLDCNKVLFESDSAGKALDLRNNRSITEFFGKRSEKPTEDKEKKKKRKKGSARPDLDIVEQRMRLLPYAKEKRRRRSQSPSHPVRK